MNKKKLLNELDKMITKTTMNNIKVLNQGDKFNYQKNCHIILGLNFARGIIQNEL